MELHQKARARGLVGRLFEYHAEVELACIGLASGGQRIAVSPRLPGLCEDYVALVRGARSDALSLVAAHRELVKAMCKLRESRGAHAQLADDLRSKRQAHTGVVHHMAGRLRQHLDQ